MPYTMVWEAEGRGRGRCTWRRPGGTSWGMEQVGTFYCLIGLQKQEKLCPVDHLISQEGFFVIITFVKEKNVKNFSLENSTLSEYIAFLIYITIAK